MGYALGEEGGIKIAFAHITKTNDKSVLEGATIMHAGNRRRPCRSPRTICKREGPLSFWERGYNLISCRFYRFPLLFGT